MFICTELIEETTRCPVLIFGIPGYFGAGSDIFNSYTNARTLRRYDLFVTLECVKFK